MTKSSYLDKLINGTLPNVPRSIYLNNLWKDYSKTNPTMISSIFTNFTNNIDFIVTGKDYLTNWSANNKNQLVTDITNNYASKITLNDRYLPIALKKSTKRTQPGDDKYKIKISAPAEYLPATITKINTSYAIEGDPIPILFPKSFSRSIQASFAKENPVGSESPIVAYNYTDAEKIPIEFDALLDYLPEEYYTLNQYVNAILDILKPTRTLSTIYEPIVMVNFADVSFIGICESVSVSYDSVYSTNSFVHATISCEFTRLENYNKLD